MRERKFIKFRVDMYDDTKFKIIDMKQERDLIHYVWSRIVVLAGKVNLEGDLYLSKTIPYTLETLAIEFNRDIDQIKLALNTLIELEMVEINDDKSYRVKNFSKHQNIKIKEKNKLPGNEEKIRNNENTIEKDFDKISEETPVENELNNVKSKEIEKLEVKNYNINEENIMVSSNSSHNKVENKIKSETKNNAPVFLEVKKSSGKKTKKKNEDIIEMVEVEEEKDMCGIIEGEYKLGPGERIIKEFLIF